MSAPRLLLLGAHGQVGWELQRALQPLGEVLAVSRAGAPHPQGGAPLVGDLEDLEGLRRTVAALRPAAIVNAAAYTAVDQAEREVERARRINAEAPGALAEAAAACGAWLVHYSTDYVFDGQGERPWREDDAPAPLNVYGATKLAGEEAIRAAWGRHLILRTQWVYGVRGGNFARTMLRLARERERLTVVDDQWGAPTGADLIADVTAHALARLLREPDAERLAGTYHLAAAGATTWHGYARFLIEQARARWPDAGWRVQAVEPIPSSAYPTPAARPRNGRLDTARLRATFGLNLPDWRAGVARWVQSVAPPPLLTPASGVRD
ncbi:dTDP-4-dehydrorhamnose reductase [Tepidimonas alkaliphilus]|uniref:dTDP-4-dehydrorhamnose reductase n=1 Tax=Tepidimonas alkaliphilus TaxID=2588942 RepID=A0A554W9D0_9BURK|nr:dTDP-4-dehydrorhamnose reductase [Tepidimonas alkaliphilus]TSE20180.1 dTDP-4-dehydrorhamnose reductase [Tepidimonas alkaliphilus]